MLRLPALLFLLTSLLAGQQLSIFLHAAPLNPRFAEMQPSDVAASIASLKSITANVPARSVRLVVFSLSKDRELFRTDSFTPNDLESVTRILSNLQLGLVDYHALQQHQLLRNLIHKELSEASPSSKIVFLGPDAFGQDKSPPSPADRLPSGQRLFYLQYRMDSSVPAQERLRTTDPEPRPLVACQGGSLYGCNNGGNSATSPSPPSLDAAITSQAPNKTTPNPKAIAGVLHQWKAKIFVITNDADLTHALKQIAR
jgi:hypothetical protein